MTRRFLHIASALNPIDGSEFSAIGGSLLSANQHVNGSQSETEPGNGHSVLVDTIDTPLNAQGDAKVIDFVTMNEDFDVCIAEPEDIAFLVRIVGGDFNDAYIAFGAVRTP